MSHVDQIAGMQVLSILGHGASSTIYAVMDPRDQQVYAAKRVQLRAASDQRFIDQALREHEVAAKLDHPVIRKSYRIIRRRKLLKTAEILVLMEFVDGTTIEQRRPRELPLIVDVFHAVAEGIEHMHRRGFVHCDLKPNNILLASDEEVKVIDLGQACPINTVKERIQGTPDYIAPEQVLRRQITPKTDVFNLGATLYWCLTNRHVPTLIPKPGQKAKRAEVKRESEFIPPIELNEQIPKSLNALVCQCLETQPRQRPETMQAVADRLSVVRHQLRKNGVNGALQPAETRDAESE
jgi:serine/threonine-protein kinase